MAVFVVFLILMLHLNQASNLQVLQYPKNILLPTKIEAIADSFFALTNNSLIFVDKDFRSAHVKQLDRGVIREAMVLAIQKDGVLLVYCGIDGFCTVQKNSWNRSHSLQQSYPVNIPNASVVMCATDESGPLKKFYAVSSGQKRIRTHKLEIDGIQLVQERVKDWTISNGNFMSREFHFSFYDSGYMYFISIDTLKQPHKRVIKIMRICNVAEWNSDRHNWPAFETELNCGSLAMNASIVSFNKLHGTVVLGLTGVVGKDQFCVVTVSSINSVIAHTFQQCCEGKYSFQIPWSSKPSSCAHFNDVSESSVDEQACQPSFLQTAVSECDFGEPKDDRYIHEGVIAAPEPVKGKLLHGYSEDSAMLGSSVLEFEGVTYLYAAQTNGTITKVWFLFISYIVASFMALTFLLQYLLSLSAHSLRKLYVYSNFSPLLGIAAGPNHIVGVVTTTEVK